MSTDAGWDLPDPFVATRIVAADEIDAYEHVNNAVYVAWFDEAAWQHSAALGMPLQRCLELDRGMAVIRSVFGYLSPALRGDRVGIATWLFAGASRLQVRRRFQARRATDGVTLARAEIAYVCIQLSTGRPARWPTEFHAAYAPLPSVSDAAGGLTPL
jgi:acyl-CoA thioester hydrolase